MKAHYLVLAVMALTLLFVNSRCQKGDAASAATAAATGLVVRDANGVKYSNLLYLGGSLFLNTTTGNVISYSTTALGTVSNGSLYFTSSDCTGQAYTTPALAKYVFMVEPAGGGAAQYYKHGAYVSSVPTMNSLQTLNGSNVWVCTTPSQPTSVVTASPTTLATGDYAALPGPLSFSTQ